MIQKIKNFLREVKIELNKVIFPSKEEVIGSTKVVIVTVLIVSVFLGIIDLGLSKFIANIIK